MNGSLGPCHTDRKRKRKRKFSLMFEIFSLISFVGSLIFFAFAFAFVRCEWALTCESASFSCTTVAPSAVAVARTATLISAAFPLKPLSNDNSQGNSIDNYRFYSVAVQGVWNTNLLCAKIFAKNCMKMNEIWLGRGVPSSPWIRQCYYLITAHFEMDISNSIHKKFQI